MSGPVIIGGGPAGSAAAIALARAGRGVTLIERHAGPVDKVCGDFLSAEAMVAIAAMGVDLSALGPSPIFAVRLVNGTRVAATRLPFAALGLTRRALDEALLQQAGQSGASVLRGHAVRRIDRNNGLLRVDCGPYGPIATDTVFLATGKHELRGASRLGQSTGLVGLKMYYTLAASQQAAVREHVELILFAGGYAGLQLVEADQAVLCVLLPGERLRADGGSWDAVLDSLTDECPHLAKRLSGARSLLDRPLAVAGLPYGYVHTRRDMPGLFRVGDQAAVIASLTGDGVALALASGSLAARSWLVRSSGASAYHRTWARRVARQMHLASLIHKASLSSVAQPWIVRVCRVWPSLMRLAAAGTRIPGRLG